jgi:hypothetical protein
MCGSVATQVNEAGAVSSRPVLAQTGSDRPTQYSLEQVLAEELDHAKTLEATNPHSPVPLVRESELQSGFELIASTSLRATVYAGADHAHLTHEIMVRLMRPDRYKELGLEPAQAAALADRFAESLLKNYPGELSQQIA